MSRMIGTGVVAVAAAVSWVNGIAPTPPPLLLLMEPRERSCAVGIHCSGARAERALLSDANDGSKLCAP